MFAERLSRELDQWVADGLVSEEQARAIRSRYATDADDEASERRGRVVSTLGVIGAVVAGLGIILFFAANWDALPRPLRVVLLLATILGAYGGGFYLRELRASHPRIGHALMLVGALAFGASLFLVGQMYHVQAHDPLAFLVWTAAVAPMAVLVRSRALASLAVLTFGGWLVYEAIDLGGEEGIGYIPVIAVLYGAALYGVGTWTRDRIDADFHAPMRVAGYVLVSFGVFVFTWRAFFDVLDERDALGARVSAGLALLTAAAAAGVILLLAARRARTALWEAATVAVAVALVLLAVLAAPRAEPTAADADPILFPLLFNAVMIALALGAIVVGYANDEVWLVNAGVAFVAIDVFARYIDLFWDMLPRSLVFVGAGLVLLALAFFLERQRSRLVERIEAG